MTLWPQDCNLFLCTHSKSGEAFRFAPSEKFQFCDKGGIVGSSVSYGQISI